jgi:hypothetical protein
MTGGWKGDQTPGRGKMLFGRKYLIRLEIGRDCFSGIGTLIGIGEGRNDKRFPQPNTDIAILPALSRGTLRHRPAYILRFRVIIPLDLII